MKQSPPQRRLGFLGRFQQAQRDPGVDRHQRRIGVDRHARLVAHVHPRRDLAKSPPGLPVLLPPGPGAAPRGGILPGNLRAELSLMFLQPALQVG